MKEFKRGKSHIFIYKMINQEVLVTSTSEFIASKKFIKYKIKDENNNDESKES